MNKQIIRLAIPNIITNLSVPMLGVVDTALMGRLEVEQYLGAVAIGGTIFGVVYWGFGFLRMGTTGLTAQAYGASNFKEIDLILKRGLLVALLSGVLLLIFQAFIVAAALYLIDAGPEVERLARGYFDIRIYAAPATLGLYVFHGWFLGMQNAKYPMILTILVNVLNVGLNLFFVKVLLMKADGVALGTVIAQYVGLVGAVVLLWRKYGYLLAEWNRREVLYLPALRRFFAISRDIIIRTLCLVFAHAFFMSKSATLSDTILAVNAILLQFINLLTYGIDGLAFAAESLVGKYKGAEKMPELKRAVRYIFFWGFSLAVGLSLTFGLLGARLLYVFTDKTHLLTQANSY
ncbi:MAG: MATE family efflux transporter, partial [Candidatus Poribacteria bacterium]|nr:MATE family efflux transporter [Candidatus Poribacteria bacterium]